MRITAITPNVSGSIAHFRKRLPMSSKRIYAQAGGKLMEISLNIIIPDDVAADIQNGSSASLSRRLLELAAIKAYEADLITEWGAIDMLGLEDREELYALFKRYDVRDHSYTIEEFEKGQAALDALLSKK
jgi:Uncharacterised protein family (UPF0175)